MDGADAAFEAAVNFLVRRTSSREAVRGRLLRKGHSQDDVDAAIDRLVRAGYLDDQRVALEVILHHARRGQGPARVEERLRELGVDDESAGRAWEEAARDHDIDTQRILRDQLRRRLPDPRASYHGAELRRVYNALLRAGFEEAAVRSALEPYLDQLEGGNDGS
jgi:regulatory protein